MRLAEDFAAGRSNSKPDRYGYDSQNEVQNDKTQSYHDILQHLDDQDRTDSRLIGSNGGSAGQSPVQTTAKATTANKPSGPRGNRAKELAIKNQQDIHLLSQMLDTGEPPVVMKRRLKTGNQA
jgi:hypothetical protein